MEHPVLLLSSTLFQIYPAVMNAFNYGNHARLLQPNSVAAAAVIVAVVIPSGHRRIVLPRGRHHAGAFADSLFPFLRLTDIPQCFSHILFCLTHRFSGACAFPTVMVATAVIVSVAMIAATTVITAIVTAAAVISTGTAIAAPAVTATAAAKQ